MSPAARLCALFGFWTVLASPLHAETPSKDQIAGWIKQLASDDFATRQEASEKLYQAGRAAEAALRQAAKEGDAEAQRLANAILDRFKWGLYPDTPPNVASAIRRYQGSPPQGKLALVDDLLQMGSPGCKAVLKIADVEEDMNLRRQLVDGFSHFAALSLPGLLVEGDLATAEELLEIGLGGDSGDGPRHYAAYWLLRDQVDNKIGSFQEEANKPDQPRAAEVLAYLYRAKGERAKAVQAARKCDKPELLEMLLAEAGEWKDLSHMQVVGGRRRVTPQLGLEAAYHRLAGNQDGFEEIRKTIRQSTRESPSDLSCWLGAKALFINDRPKEAMEQLLEGERVFTAFEILCARQQYDEAFALADRAKKKPGDAFLFDVLRGRSLCMLGERAEGAALFAKLSDRLDEGRVSNYDFLDLVKAELRAGLTDAAFNDAARLLVATPVKGLDARLLNFLFPEQGASAVVWWRWLRQQSPEDKPTQTMQRLRGLLAGKLGAQDWQAVTESLETAARNMAAPDSARAFLALATASQAAGRQEQRLAALEETVRQTPTPALRIRLGDCLADCQDWARTALVYGEAWEADRSQPLPLFLRGWALQQSGQEEEGRKLRERAHWLPLGDDYTRAAFAAELARRGHQADARRERALLLSVGAPGASTRPPVLLQLAGEAEAAQDLARSTDLYQQALLGLLGTSSDLVESTAYVRLPYRLHELRARSLLAAARTDEALAEAQLCQAFLPCSADLAVHLVPGLDQLGRTKEADALFETSFTHYDQLCRDYPHHHQAHNQLAWLAVSCQRRLDDALKHARRATEFAPDTADYWYTLAEVHDRRGEKKAARDCLQKCVDLEPKNKTYRQRLERIEADQR
jgi:tetratricopeptide (TPR) repeat protein